jgi:hypothetical protein
VSHSKSMCREAGVLSRIRVVHVILHKNDQPLLENEPLHVSLKPVRRGVDVDRLWWLLITQERDVR